VENGSKTVTGGRKWQLLLLRSRLQSLTGSSVSISVYYLYLGFSVALYKCGRCQKRQAVTVVLEIESCWQVDSGNERYGIALLSPDGTGESVRTTDGNARNRNEQAQQSSSGWEQAMMIGHPVRYLHMDYLSI
jgi:hypothetical protein